MQDLWVVGKNFWSFLSKFFMQPFQYFQIVNLVDSLSSWYKFIKNNPWTIKFANFIVSSTYLHLLSKYTKYLKSCKNPIHFIYILVPPFKFVYRSCTLIILHRLLCVITHKARFSDTYNHITYFTRCLTRPLAEHTLQHHGLGGPGQCLWKIHLRRSSRCFPYRPVSAVHVQPLLACSSEGRVENLCVKFSSHHMKEEGCNSSEWPDRIEEKNSFFAHFHVQLLVE